MAKGTLYEGSFSRHRSSFIRDWHQWLPSSFNNAVIKLSKKSGFLFTALYLKQCSTCLMQYYAQHEGEKAQLPVFVSLTRTGLPRIIPPFHRQILRRRDSKADLIVKIYLSWFSLAKLVPLAPKVSKKTFSSMTQECISLDRVLSICSD